MTDRPVTGLPTKTAAELDLLTDYIIGHGDENPAAFRSQLEQLGIFLAPTIGAEIIENGSDANGEYVRFADGTQIVVVRQGGIGEVTTSFGSGYIRNVGTVAWPAAFISAPRTFAFASKSSGNAPIWAAGSTSAATTTSAPAVWLNVWLSTSDVNNVVERLAVGRWK